MEILARAASRHHAHLGHQLKELRGVGLVPGVGEDNGVVVDVGRMLEIAGEKAIGKLDVGIPFGEAVANIERHDVLRLLACCFFVAHRQFDGS